MTMSLPMSAAEVLDREFLEIRAKLLEVAASFDRLDRAEGSTAADRRIEQIHEALRILQEEQDDRAEQIQILFSRDYEDDWREKFDLPAAV